MALPDSLPSDPRLRDPLSDTTRKERRNLLASAFLAIVIAKTGLVPNEIKNLGITFSEVDQSLLLKAIAAAVAYFLLAFIIYGIHDLLGWELAHFQQMQLLAGEERLKMKAREAEQAAKAPPPLVIQPHRAALSPKQEGELIDNVFLIMTGKLRGSINVANAVRRFFEFAVPVGVGLYAILSLWNAW